MFCVDMISPSPQYWIDRFGMGYFVPFEDTLNRAFPTYRFYFPTEADRDRFVEFVDGGGNGD